MGLQAKEKFPFFKNDQKSMTSLPRATEALLLVCPLWNHFQKKICPKSTKYQKFGPIPDSAHGLKWLGSGAVFCPFWPPVPRPGQPGAHTLGHPKYPRGTTKSHPNLIGQASNSSFMPQKRKPTKTGVKILIPQLFPQGQIFRQKGSWPKILH